MFAISGSGSVVLSTYTSEAPYNDEWNLAKIGYMSETATWEAQQNTNWCWAATYMRAYSDMYCEQSSDGALLVMDGFIAPYTSYSSSTEIYFLGNATIVYNDNP